MPTKLIGKNRKVLSRNRNIEFNNKLQINGDACNIEQSFRRSK